MTPQPAEPTATPMFGQKAAFTLGAVLIAAFGIVLAFTARDNARRSEIETVTQPRAVGDEQFVALAEPLDVSQPVARFEGRSLFVQETDPIEARDSKMMKAGRDESGRFFVYRSPEPKDAEFHFLKTAHGRYVKATAK